MAATPVAMAHTTGSRGLSILGGSRSTGSAPFAASARKTATPIFQPSVRKTFVAPRLPDPCFRRSTLFALPASKANGMEPEIYANANAMAGCTLRFRLRAALATHQDTQRIAREWIRLAKAIVEKANVVLLDEIGVIAEKCDRRRCDTHLRSVVELHLATGRLVRLTAREQLRETDVDVGRRYPHAGLLI